MTHISENLTPLEALALYGETLPADYVARQFARLADLEDAVINARNALADIDLSGLSVDYDCDLIIQKLDEIGDSEPGVQDAVIDVADAVETVREGADTRKTALESALSAIFDNLEKALS